MSRGELEPYPDGPQWSLTTRRIVVIVVSVITLFVVIFVLSGLLTQLVLASLLAFLLQPLIDWLHERLNWPRWLGILLVYLLIAGVTYFIILIGPILLVDSLAQIDLSAISANLDQWLADVAENLSTVTILGTTVDLSPVIDAIAQAPSPSPDGALLEVILGTVAAAAGALGVVISIVSFVFFTLLIAVYLSGSATRYVGSALRLFPESSRPEVRVLGSRVNQVWNDYVRGQVIMALIIGSTTWLVTWLLGVPGSFVLGLIAGALECIPTFGPIIATIPAVIVALFQGSTRFDMPNGLFALVVIGAYLLIQQLESSIIAPKVMGSSVLLPPIIVLLAITAGLQVWGVLGAIIAVPVVATFRTVAGFLWRKAVPDAG
ncbi:MAG TPA: AI-2E family transporter [Acidimicrobiia bacterium]|nr:AI-2E family transporter [Acidimicrobiia bacterium]